MSAARQYVETILGIHAEAGREKYVAIWQARLDRGEHFTKIAPEVSAELRRMHRYQVKACWRNTAKYAMQTEAAEVYHGVACSFAGMPMPHAWCVGADRRVLELTWPFKLRDPVDYFGVHIPRQFLLRHILDHSEIEDLVPFLVLGDAEALKLKPWRDRPVKERV